MNNDELLSAEQTARSLGVTEKTLRKMVRAGMFPDSFPTSDGRRYWIGRDVKAFLYLRSRIGTRRLAPVEGDSVEKSEKNLVDERPPSGGKRGGNGGET